MNDGMKDLSLLGRAIAAVALLGWACPAQAQEGGFIGTFDDWNAFAEKEGGKPLCYAASLPKKAEGNYAKRGDTYIMVTHRPAEKSFNVFSVRAGYTYQEGSEVEVTIGGQTFNLFTDAGYAWAEDEETDSAIIVAMRAGKNMVVKGSSSRGTLTTDTYSLIGFTAAFSAINSACGVESKPGG
jgi:hypothetical protein